MIKTDKIEGILKGLIDMFESGDMPETIARAIIKRQEGSSPSDSWSLGNLLIRTLAGTEDARGYKQWQAVGRYPKKGAKAFYILAPCTKTITETNEEGEEIKVTIVTGFRPVPVFRYEDTEGKPLQKPYYKPAVLPPLANVAEAWGIKIKYGPFTGRFYGYYDFGSNEIFLATHDVNTFFHELGHCAHEKVIGSLKGGQDPRQEIVAEMTSAVLCQLYGFKGYEKYSYDYIKHYAGKNILKEIMGLLSEIEETVRLILETAESFQKKIA